MTLWKRIYFWYLEKRTYLKAKRILKRSHRYEGAFNLEYPDYDFTTGQWNS